VSWRPAYEENNGGVAGGVGLGLDRAGELCDVVGTTKRLAHD
jgi:hypothetical protein